MSTSKSKNSLLPSVNRRAFLKTSGAVAGAAAATTLFVKKAHALDSDNSVPDTLETSADVDIKYSVCLMCHSACGFKARVDRASGVLLKVNGNPYHPNTCEADTRIAYTTDPATVKDSQAGTLCPKGQAMMETLYNPNRLTTPLRRVGARGAGLWESITWDQALTEIAQRLAPYAQHVDSNGNYVGKYLDPNGNWIDSNDYGLGPVANQVVLSHGRIEHGQKEFTDRFWKTGFGTINYRGDHTSICEASHHVAGMLLGVNSSGKTTKHLKPDIANCEYLVWFGSNPCEASFPTQTLGKKIARRVAQARDNAGENFAMVVVDPRFSNSAKMAAKWVPVKPGGDAALALGIARYMVDNAGINTAFLTAATKAAAAAVGAGEQLNFSDATHLVWTSGPNKGRFVDASDVGVGSAGERVCVNATDNNTIAIAPFTSGAVTGELEPGPQTFGSDSAKTAFSLLKARLHEHSIGGWAALAGVSAADITEIGANFAAAGTRAVANGYRGACKHTHGTYTTLAWHLLNTLAGNIDQKGGHIHGASHLHEMGGKVTGQLSLKSINGSGYDSARSAAGVHINRTKSDFFAHKLSYPAWNNFEPDKPRRPWFPLAFEGNYQEILAGIADGYPYPIGALITYWNNWAYSTPAGKAVALDTLRDEGKVPFFVAIDVEFGETSSLADIILPECTFMERWSTPHTGPTVLTNVSAFRHPVVGEVNPSTGEYTTIFNTNLSSPNGPRNIEDILIGLGGKIQAAVRADGDSNYVFPGIGAGAWDTSGLSGFTADLNVGHDWFKNILQNYAIEAGDGLTPADIEARGGWFEEAAQEYDSNGLPSHKFGGYMFQLYIEKLATTKNVMTGQSFDPLPGHHEVTNAMGQTVNDPDFPLHIVTYKDIFHAMARTAVNPTLMALQPENPIWVSSADARNLGIRTGDPIRIWSRTNQEGVTGKAWVTERIRPGVVAVAHSYGHWEMGSKAHVVDGQGTTAYASRGAGTTMNPICRVDDSVGNVALQDMVGGSISFYDTRVRVERV